MIDVSPVVDAQEIPSGSVSATSGSPGFTALLAMIVAGDARYGGDQFFTDGSRVIMAEVPPNGRRIAANPEEMHLIIDPGYFERAEQEYTTPWKIVWWREAIQNAVDAGAKNLTLSVVEDGDLMEVTCLDDGSGMDKDTLQFKFLALGGTTKGKAGQIGGFGVAKKILCFRWPKWIIHTREHILRSENGKMEYEVGERLEGTLLKVWMPKESGMYTRTDYAIDFLGRCNLPGVKASIDGEPWSGRWLPNGKHIRDLRGDRAEAKVYYTKASKLVQGVCYVRTSEGLFMHERYLSHEVKGYVIIELVAKDNPKTGQPYPSRDFLSASRDDLTDETLKQAICEFLNELAVETKSALKSKAASKIQVFSGEGGKFKPEFKALYSNVIYNMSTKKTRAGVQFTDEAKRGIIDLLGSSREINKLLMNELLNSTYSGETQIEAALFQLTSGFWKRDFILYPDPDMEGFNIPKRFHPEHQTSTLHQLIRTWVNLCEYALVALNCHKEFGVGWCFSGDMSACHLKKDGVDWLLLNPFIIDESILRRMGVKEKKTGAKLKENPEWKSTDRNHLRVLFSLAIHECTHFVDDIGYHSEAFSSALTYNTALAGPGFEMLSRVAKAARDVARAERRLEPEQVAASAKPVRSEIVEIRDAMMAVTPPGSNFYRISPNGPNELFLAISALHPEPEVDLYAGNPVCAVDTGDNFWFIYRNKGRSYEIPGDAIDALKLAGPIYWSIIPHYQEVSTLAMAASAHMGELLAVYAFTHGIWPNLAFPRNLNLVLEARNLLQVQLEAEYEIYREKNPWTEEGFARFEPDDFKMAHGLLTRLSSPKWGVLDGITVHLDRSVARGSSEEMERNFEETFRDKFQNDAGQTAFYVNESWLMPIPDARRQGAAWTILSRLGDAWVVIDGNRIRYTTSSGFTYMSHYSKNVHELSLVDPVKYQTLILALMGGLHAAFKYETLGLYFQRNGWPRERGPVDIESSMRESILRKTARELEALKDELRERPRDGVSYADIEATVLFQVREAGLAE